MPRQNGLKGNQEIDQNINSVRVHVKEIQHDSKRNGSQVAEVFKYRGGGLDFLGGTISKAL